MTEATDRQKKFYSSAKLSTQIANALLTEDDKSLRISEISLALANTYLRLAELDWMNDDSSDRELEDKVLSGIITDELKDLFQDGNE